MNAESVASKKPPRAAFRKMHKDKNNKGIEKENDKVRLFFIK